MRKEFVLHTSSHPGIEPKGISLVHRMAILPLFAFSGNHNPFSSVLYVFETVTIISYAKASAEPIQWIAFKSLSGKPILLIVQALRFRIHLLC